MDVSPDWPLIDEVARSLGVTDVALEQWHTRRSVPHKWRLRLILASSGRLSVRSRFDVDASTQVAS